MAYRKRTRSAKRRTYKRRKRTLAKKRYRSRYSRRVEPAARSRCQSTEFLRGAGIAMAELTVQTLDIQPVEFRGQQTGGGGRRVTPFVKLSGISVCNSFVNTRINNSNAAIEVHWALVQLKAPLDVFSDTDRAAEISDIRAEIQNRFFTNHEKTFAINGDGLNTKPFTSAINATEATAAWRFRYLCDPLNSSIMNILDHRKRRLDAKNVESKVHEWNWSMSKYYPINKRIEFHNEDDVFGKLPFFTLCWYTTVDFADYPLDAWDGVTVPPLPDTGPITYLRRMEKLQPFYHV